MSKKRSSLGKKAAKATVRHSVRGVSAKARRKPLRSVTLLTIGWILGVTSGWLVGRKTGNSTRPAAGSAETPSSNAGNHPAAGDSLTELQGLEHPQPAE
jgi:hypothetical protein